MGVLGRDLSERLKQLDKYLQILQSMQSYSGKEFRGEPEHYGATERFLHLATKAINDMVSHVIAEEQWGSVDQYSDLSRLFGSEGYIDDAQRDQWIRMIGFRNVLVHDYLDVDREIVYTVPQEDLDDLDQLKRLFAKFL
jgi:uncharacterized protein YutE (UPF0331/DUF86 family)